MKKWFLILMSVLIALPVFGTPVFAEEAVVYEDGEYEVAIKALKADKSEDSLMDKYISDEGTLVVKDGNLSLVIAIPHTDDVIVDELKMEDEEPLITEGEVVNYYEYDLIELKNEYSATLTYVAPVIGEHTVPLIISVEVLEELPVVVPEDPEEPETPEDPAEEEPEEPETPEDPAEEEPEKPETPEDPKEDPKENPEEDNERTYEDAVDSHEKYTVNYEFVSGSDLSGFFEKDATLVVKDGKNYIQLKGTRAGQTLASVKYDNKEVTWVELNDDGTYIIQFEVDSFSEAKDFSMHVSIPIHDRVYSSSISFDEETKRPNVVKQEVEITPNKEYTILPGNIVKVDGVEIHIPEDLKEAVLLTVTPKKSSDLSNLNDLEVAGSVYDFDFTGLEDYEGEFTLVMDYDNTKYTQNEVDIYYYDASKNEWIAQNGEVENGTVTIQPNHFSIYGVLGQVKEVVQPVGELEPDKVSKIKYDILNEDKSGISVADTFFEKPAYLLEKDGVKYIQVTVTNASMIRSLSNEFGNALIVSVDEEADTMVVQLRVPGDLADMQLDMYVFVPGMYETSHKTFITFHPETLEESEEALQLVGSPTTDNENGPYVEEGGADRLYGGGEPDPEPTPSPNPDPNTPEKPELGDGENGDNGSNNGSTDDNNLNPKTGEETNVLLYVLLLIGSAIPLAIKAKRRFA